MSTPKRSARKIGSEVIPRQKFEYFGLPSVILIITKRDEDGARWALISPSIMGRVLWKLSDLRGAHEVSHDEASAAILAAERDEL